MQGLTAERIVARLQASLKDRRVRFRRSFGTRHRGWVVQRQVDRYSTTSELVRALELAGSGPLDTRVAGLLCYTLGHRQAVEAVPVLLEMLDREELRFEVVDALCHIEDPRAGVPLLSLFEAEQDAGMRRLYALSLGVCKCTEASGALVEALTDPDSAVRGYAGYALGLIGDQSARSAIEHALEAGADAYDEKLMKKGLALLSHNVVAPPN